MSSRPLSLTTSWLETTNLLSLDAVDLASVDEDGNWSDVEELPFNNDNYSVAHPALSLDGKKLYFASDMPGTTGESDLWYVDIYKDGS